MTKKKETRKARPVKVWHIYRFEQRFEMPDDFRKGRQGPLIYTKSFVGSGCDDESIAFMQQIEQLKASPIRAYLRSAFEDLKNIAANRSRKYRGYLLDGMSRPAMVTTIAQWIGLDVAMTKKVLKELESIGLLERVDLPDFEAGGDDKDENATGNGDFPEQGGTGRRPLKKKGKGKGKGKGTVKATGLSASGKEKKNKEKKSTKKSRGQGKGNSSGTDNENAATSPSSAPKPTKPMEADAGSITHPDGRTARHRPPVDILDERTKKRRTPAQAEFASVIFKILKVPYPSRSENGARELGNYAQAWGEAQAAGLGTSLLDELWEKSVRSAKKIGIARKRKTYQRSPEAVWRYEFNRRLRKLMSTAAEVKLA